MKAAKRTEVAPCECPLEGWCQRHRRSKSWREHELCRTDAAYRSLWDSQANARPATPDVAAAEKRARVQFGPGSWLKAIFAELGFSGCQICGERAAEMDRWGVEGCRERFDEIVAWLRESAEQLGWGERFKLLGRATASGWLLRVNWLDPIPSLVKEAIKRAERV